MVASAPGSSMFLRLFGQNRKARSDKSTSAYDVHDQMIAELLPQMVWVIDTESGESTYGNRRFHDYYGRMDTSRATRMGRIHPEDRLPLETKWGLALQGRGAFEIECRLLRSDGAFRWHRMILTPVTRDGTAAEWLATAIDINDIVSARQRLEDTSEILYLAQEAAAAGIWAWDLGCDTVWLSPECARLNSISLEPGRPPGDGVEIASDHWLSEIVPEDKDRVVAETWRAIRERGRLDVEFRVALAAAEGSGYRWLHSLGQVIVDPASNEPIRMVGLDMDISDRRHQELALRESEVELRESRERLSYALDGGSDGLWDADMEGGDFWMSDRWYALLGLSRSDFKDDFACWRIRVHPDDESRAMKIFVDHLKGLTAHYECEYRMMSGSGRYMWLLARAKVVKRNAAGRALRVVGTQIDITARKEAEGRIERMARHDGLTDLPNRNHFYDCLERNLAVIRDSGQEGVAGLAVLAIDLDRFKSINDTLGHLIGDALLSEVAARMERVLRLTDFVARLGGDEFAIIQGGGEDLSAAAALADRLIAEIGAPFSIDGHDVRVGASIGIALSPRDAIDAEQLFKAADLALRSAKSGGRNSFRFFEPAMAEAERRRYELERDLRTALARDEFEVHYQPIFDAADGTIVSFEGLVRWRHATRGLVGPTEFIPLAEEAGLIVPLGDWVLRTACDAARSWPDAIGIAVNVSAIQLKRGSFPLDVATALAAAGLPAHRLELEITETALMQDSRAMEGVEALKALGVKIALDDFGTGYSSLSYLLRLSLDRIKLDKSFVGAIADSRSIAIVQAVVAMSTALGMAVTAEGVETEEQFEMARSHGCTEIQGFLLGRPVTAKEATRLANSAPDPRSARVQNEA